MRAVELSWFESDGGVTALTPRVIGETERAQTEKAARTALPAIGREAWIAERLGPCDTDVVAAAELFVAMVAELGGRAEVTSSQGSIIAVFDAPGGPLYPLRLTYERRGSIQLCLAYLVNRPAFASAEGRQRLYEDLVAIVGPLSTATMNGYPGFDARKLNELQTRAALSTYLRQLSYTAAGTAYARLITLSLCLTDTPLSISKSDLLILVRENSRSLSIRR